MASLAKPGGNITGMSGIQVKLSPKRLESLKEAVPRASRVAALYSRVHPSHGVELTAIRKRTKELGLALQPFDVTRVEGLQAAFARLNASRPDAIFVLFDYRTLIYRQLIAEFEARNWLLGLRISEPLLLRANVLNE